MSDVEDTDTAALEVHNKMQQEIAQRVLDEDDYQQYTKEMQQIASQQLIQNITAHPMKHKQAVMSLSACSDGENIIISGGTSDFFGKSASKQVWSFNVQEEKFTALPDLPTTIRSHRMICTQQKVFIIGGIKGNEEYDTIFVLEDIQDNEWKSIEIEASIGEYPSVCAVDDSNYIHIIEDTYHFVLDAVTYELSYIADTPFKVFGADLCEFDDKLYVFGGYFPREYKDDIYVFDMEEYEWSKVDVKLPTNRAFYGLIKYQQYALLVGGYINADIIVFDLQNHLFLSQTLNLPKPISRMSVALVDQKVHIFGGMFGGCTQGINDHYVVQLKDLVAEAKTLASGFCRELNKHKAVDVIWSIIAEYLILYLNIQYCLP